VLAVPDGVWGAGYSQGPGTPRVQRVRGCCAGRLCCAGAGSRRVGAHGLLLLRAAAVHAQGAFNERPGSAIERVIIHHSRNLLLVLAGADITRPVALARTWCLYETLTALLVRAPVRAPGSAPACLAACRVGGGAALIRTLSCLPTAISVCKTRCIGV
jgi:hypothetical protein